MKKIVLIEDDAAIRDCFSLALDSTVYQTIAYETGNFMMQSNIETPDVFVIDKNLAGTNGLDICRFIKGSEQFHNVPVIMISASTNLEQAAHDAGADCAIAKPFSLKTLRTTISQYTC